MIHIPTHNGSCYVHTINRGLQLMDNGNVLVNFASVGPAIGYTCSVDRGPEESCKPRSITSVCVPVAWKQQEG